MSQDPKSTCNAETAANGGSSATTPTWLVVLLAVALYGGLLYLDRHGGDFQAQVYAPYHDLNQLAAYQPMEKVDPLYKRGEQLYTMACSACHQATGVGAAGQCPPLVGSDWVLQKDPARIIRIVQLGAGGPITVKGVDHVPSVVMPPLGGSFPEDADLAAVLTYVRQTWGNKAPSVTPAQVKKVRAEIGDRKDSWTAAELLKVPLAE
jgi:mono/diheme cytochrome c family protein